MSNLLNLFNSISHLFPENKHERIKQIVASLENVLPPSLLNDPSQLFESISNVLESQELQDEALDHDIQKTNEIVPIDSSIEAIYSIQITPEGATDIVSGLKDQDNM